MLILSACKNEAPVYIAQEIKSLKTVEQQKVFLESIIDIDQKVRRDEKDILKKLGYESKEYKAAIQKMVDVDRINLEKIELYLSIHGHPNRKSHGDRASDCPNLVIHHAQGGAASRLRNFKYLYPAYLKGDIDDTSFTFYLNRTYEMKFGNRISWTRPFRTEEELDTLYKALELTEFIK